ncbi:Odorant-binding protein 57a [Drosophila willistoni]|uniref:Odorant-binding protein 57a n=1 Tax=Drosophila willistoni TaxID=7260 RepID=B4MKG0_DROWI|nr:general odorant-binding protein 57b [Drosophila willistoni]EDW72599.2 Odorant-binding protein 57a [Drosophila willistoni]
MLAITTLVGLILIGLCFSLTKAHPFDFLDESIDDFDDCLSQNNITLDEYEQFELFENLKNILNEKVEWRYKCNIHCQLERQPRPWLNEQGKMDLQLMNISNTETGEAIATCMTNAEDEQCSYSFKLVLCAFANNFPLIEYETEMEIEEYAEETNNDDDDYDNCG